MVPCRLMLQSLSKQGGGNTENNHELLCSMNIVIDIRNDLQERDVSSTGFYDQYVPSPKKDMKRTL